MAQRFTNVPPAETAESNSTVQAFDNYQTSSIEISSSVLAAMKSYFVNRGFGDVSAESIAITIITQAKQDGYNPMQILDTLRGLSNVELSGLVSEILNYNRFKTSSLGYAQTFKPNPQIQRNIIDGYTPFIPNPPPPPPIRSTIILTDENGEDITDETGSLLTTG